MKNLFLILLFLSISFWGVSQNILDKKVDFNYENIRLKNFFQDIENRYNVQFSHSKIFSGRIISIKYKGDLKKALDKVFEFSNLEYKLINDYIVVKKKSIGVLTGNIKGKIVNKDTKMPIIGATIIVKNFKPFTGTSSDINGHFIIKNLPTARYSFTIGAIGFENKEISEVRISPTKENIIEITLSEKISNIDEVVIYAKLNKYEAINEMAVTSARAFSVEETEKYAMSISDPARMALNYAGVTNSGDDSSNDLVIRGNSPRGLLWRLEGIEIPNPNHFGNTGAKGGIISSLSSSTLNNSDFYSSTFPSEFGNAISGVFDLRYRKGNNTKREHSIKFGTLGLEAFSEGYFSLKSKASYAFKFRFSTIDFLKPMSVELKNIQLSFQDLSFKVAIPTKNIGNFSIFALGGFSQQINNAVSDSTYWESIDDKTQYEEKQRMGVIGISNKKILSNKTYIKTIVASTFSLQKKIIDLIDTLPNINKLRINNTDFNNINVLTSFTLNHQIDKRNLVQTGFVYNLKNYDYFLNYNQSDSVFIFFNSKGFTHYVEGFTQWKNRFSTKLTINTGVHLSYLHLNKSYSIDPRIGLNYKISKLHSIAFSTGLFSRAEHISTYLLENSLSVSLQPNINLKMNKSFQSVFSYNYRFAKDYNLKAEIYYQYLFDIPVSSDINSNYSTLNSENIFDILINNTKNGGELISAGKGQNYGIDVTVEKFFSKKFYALITASLYDSKFTALSGKQFHTKFANNFLINVLAGKEFVVGKYKNNSINLNAKYILKGGKRYTPLNLRKTDETNIEFINEYEVYSKQFKPYYRFDLGFNYKLNKKNVTHTFSLDIQNVTDHRNDYDIYYNFKDNKIEERKQLGLIPFISYKLDFSFKRKKR